jgi:multiple sugar transport system substrate-binding protein
MGRISKLVGAVTFASGCIPFCLAAFLMIFGGALFGSAKTRLEFVIWSDNPAHLEVLSSIAEAYQSIHPDLSIKFTSVLPYSSFPREIAIRVTASNPPDLSWMLERFAPQFISTGALSDLSEAAARYDFQDFAKPTLRLWQQGKALYGLPFSTSPFFILYNKDLIAQAGVRSPLELMKDGAWTWEELREIARTIKEKTGRFGYSFWMDQDSIFALTPMMRAYGGDIWDAGGTCTAGTPAALRAMRLMHRMIAVDGSIPRRGDPSDFFTGGVAMTIAQLSMVNGLKQAPFAWDMVPLPRGPAGEVRLIGQAAVVVYKASKVPDVAADFAAFLTDRENMAKLARFFPPSRTSILQSRSYLSSNPLVSVEQMTRAVADSLAKGEVLPFHRNYGKLEPIVRLFFDKLQAQDADVQRIAADMCRAMSGYLGR